MARAGWERPRLFVDAAVDIPDAFATLPCTFRDEKVGAFPNYYLALTELLLRHPRADAYLVAQDDAIFEDRESLPAYLDRVLWPGRTPCLVSLYSADPDTAPRPGWHPADGRAKSGPVAMAFPRNLAKAFVNDPVVFEHRWDRDEQTATSLGDVIVRWAHGRGCRSGPDPQPGPARGGHEHPLADGSCDGTEARGAFLRRHLTPIGRHAPCSSRATSRATGCPKGRSA